MFATLKYEPIARMLAAGILMMTLAGCATVENIREAATGAKVPPTLVIVAGSTYDAVEVTAANYLTLHRCDQHAPPCRNPAARIPLKRAMRAGRAARDNLEQFLVDHPNQLADKGLYDAVVAATKTLQQIFDQYGVR